MHRSPGTRDVWMMLVPARHGWEVPAALAFGGWNACPEPQVHVAVLHRWHQRYGAQLVGLTFDTLSFHVDRPPQDREAALALAREHLCFCSEGAEEFGPEDVAGDLIGQETWWFWWD